MHPSSQFFARDAPPDRPQILDRIAPQCVEMHGASQYKNVERRTAGFFVDVRHAVAIRDLKQETSGQSPLDSQTGHNAFSFRIENFKPKRDRGI